MRRRWTIAAGPLPIRAWLVLFVLVAAIPGGALLAYGAARERALLEEQVTERLRRTAAAAADRLTATVERAHGAVSALAELREVKTRDLARCREVVKEIQQAERVLANVSVADLDGHIFCTALPNPSDVSVGDRLYFQRAMRHDDGVVGRLVVSRIFERPTLHVAEAVLDGTGKRVGVAFAALDLTRLDDLFAFAGPGEVLTLVDGEGTVAARHPSVGSWIGSKQDAPLVQRMLAADEGTAEVAGLDGVVRMYAFAPVRLADGVTDLKVSAGLERGFALEPVNRAFHATMILYGIAVTLGVLAAWLLGQFELGGPLARIRRAARAISSGALDARAGAVRGPLEVAQLARAFDDMAGSIAELTRENRLILESVGVGIFGVDRRGIVTFANPTASELLGYPAAELRGRTAHDLCLGTGEACAKRRACGVFAAVEEGVVRGLERLELRRRDGTALPVDALATPMRAGGEIVGAVITFHDVTERARLEAQLRHAQKMEAVGRLAGGIAHDFNNVLTVILSAGNSLVARAHDGETRADAEEVLSSASRAAALTRQLLAFSRVQPPSVQPTDVNAVVERWHPLLRRVLGEDVDTALSLAASGRVLIDPGQLEQVLMNLAVNARDAMPDGGKLTISTSSAVFDERGPRGRVGAPAGRYAVVEVSDTGTGMDEDTLAQIFEPFFTTKPPGSGTGLGLSTVWGIVKQNGGDVHVHSAAGGGTTFRVYFPAVDAGEEPAAPPAAEGDLGGSEVLLLVEDDELVRRVALRVLRSAGYEVVEASNGRDALHAVEGGLRFDLLVTDVVMPEGSGAELVDRVRRLRPDARALFMSGFSAGALAHRRILSGDAAFLEKPFTPEALLRAVRAVLVRSRAA
jgi:PAS domain S-box-containing protein